MKFFFPNLSCKKFSLNDIVLRWKFDFDMRNAWFDWRKIVRNKLTSNRYMRLIKCRNEPLFDGRLTGNAVFFNIHKSKCTLFY